MSAPRGHRLILILMRHAKSDWGDPTLADFDRPLNQRGRRDAPRMGQWLATVDQIPDRLLCSSAVRTRQTVASMSDLWHSAPSVHFCDDLYQAGPQQLIDVVRREGGDAQRVLVVAHNPGLTSLASRLAGTFLEMPTAAIAMFGVPIDGWQEFDGVTGAELLEFMRPKGLR